VFVAVLRRSQQSAVSSQQSAVGTFGMEWCNDTSMDNELDKIWKETAGI
jgi:hypothetical protein